MKELEIIDQQIDFLHAKSSLAPLTVEDVRILEILVRSKQLITSGETNADAFGSNPFSGFDTETLKVYLENLSLGENSGKDDKDSEPN